MRMRIVLVLEQIHDVLFHIIDHTAIKQPLNVALSFDKRQLFVQFLVLLKVSVVKRCNQILVE